MAFQAVDRLEAYRTMAFQAVGLVDRLEAYRTTAAQTYVSSQFNGGKEMVRSNLTRRDFNKLAAAAFGGVVTGTMVGCGDKTDKTDKTDSKSPDGSDTKSGSAAPDTGDVAELMKEPHVCKGLNTCEGKGKGGGNACHGQSACFTAEKSGCHDDNQCKGEGGCGATAGNNACSNKGECGVPLKKETWEKTRAKFKAAWEKVNSPKTLGDAPA